MLSQLHLWSTYPNCNQLSDYTIICLMFAMPLWQKVLQYQIDICFAQHYILQDHGQYKVYHRLAIILTKELAMKLFWYKE